MDVDAFLELFPPKVSVIMVVVCAFATSRTHGNMPNASQRQGLLERLRVEESRQEYIKWELEVATNKAESRARRVAAAKAAWSKWCTAKNNKLR